MAAPMQTSLHHPAQEQFKKLLPGHQRYHIEVPGTASAALLDVIAFDATEKLGEPYRIQIQLAHPQALNRSDYLGKLASLHITPPPPDWLAPAGKTADARKFSGCITGFNKAGHSTDLHHYTFVIEPIVARLRLVNNNRIYQNQTAPQIIEAILRDRAYQRHLQDKHPDQEQTS